MQILQVELENIKSFTRAEVSFTAGVNAIVGHNGAGKSTLLEAIGFALFDKLAYSASEFLREGARTGSVAVTFQSSYDERIYRVERRLGGSHLFFVHDPELGARVCEGKPDVLAFVRRHSGADQSADLGRLFGDAIGVAQGTLTAVFLQTPSLRKAAFDTLLQVDEYKDAFDRLLEPRNLLRDRQRDVAEQRAVLAARLERLPQLVAMLAQQAADLARDREALIQVEAQLDSVQARKQALEAARAAVEALGRRQAQLDERAQRLAGQAATADEALAAALAAQAQVAANQAGYAHYLAAQEAKRAGEARLRQRQALATEQAAVDKTIALCDAEAVRLADALAAATAAADVVVALTPAVARQAEVEAALAAAQDEVRALAAAQEQAVTQRQQIAQVEARLARLRTQLAAAATVQANIAQAEQQVADGREAVDQLKTELATFQVEAETVKQQNTTLSEIASAQCPVCEQPLTPEHRAQMLERNDRRLAGLRQQYAAQQGKVREAERAIKEQSEQLKRLRDELHHLPRPDEVEETARMAAEATARMAAIEATAERLAAAPARRAALDAELLALENPRQRSAVAAQQAALRAGHQAALASNQERRIAAEKAMALILEQLAAFADLEEQLVAASAALAAHEQAFKIVLEYRQQAESAPRLQGEVAQLRQEQQAAAQALAQVEAELNVASAKFDPAEYAGIVSSESSLRSHQGALTSRIMLLQADVERLTAEVSALHAQQNERTTLETELQGLATQGSALDAIRQLLRQSGPFITQAVVRQIGADAGQIFGELMQDFSRQLSWSEDYGILLEVDGVSRQFAQLSGGEQMSAALAVRLALVREMSNIDIAFFDEPTANLDDARREALARQIMNIKGFRQLFVISHDDTFEQATQNLIRVHRHGNTSYVTSQAIA